MTENNINKVKALTEIILNIHKIKIFNGNSDEEHILLKHIKSLAFLELNNINQWTKGD